jgi:integrase
LRANNNGKPRDLIFGVGKGGFSGWSKSKARLDEAIEQGTGKPLPHWTLHDLRRSFATYISGGLPANLLAKLTPTERKLAEGLKVQPHTREAILSHSAPTNRVWSALTTRRPTKPRKRPRSIVGPGTLMRSCPAAPAT